MYTSLHFLLIVQEDRPSHASPEHVTWTRVHDCICTPTSRLCIHLSSVFPSISETVATKASFLRIWSLFVSLNCRLDLTHMAPWGLEQEWAGHPKVSGYTLWVPAFWLKCHPWLPRVRDERSLPLFPVSTSASALHSPDSSTTLISLTPPQIYPCCAHFQECPSFSSLLGFPQNWSQNWSQNHRIAEWDRQRSIQRGKWCTDIDF